MLKDIWTLTKDFGIEVLPYVPVIYEGIDAMGGGAAGWSKELGGVDGRADREGLYWGAE